MLSGGFFIGLHEPSKAKHFRRCCISVNRLLKRRGDFDVGIWLMDSGAFTAVSTHGRHVLSVDEYADQIRRWSLCGFLAAAVSQDWMCEPFILQKTGLCVDEHQALTISSFDELQRQRLPSYVMPVIQGFSPEQYAKHVHDYGKRLKDGAWVGVGSVCKRNRDPQEIERVLAAILAVRPDLKLHGFGIKISSLKCGTIRKMLHSADSMAWSFAARQKGNGNDLQAAVKFAKRIDAMEVQRPLFV